MTELPEQAEMTPFLSDKDKDLLRRTLLRKFHEDQQEIFLRRCERSKLDPFSGQIHPTLRNIRVRKENGEIEWLPTLVCVTGIYGLLAVAIRTGEYDGTEISWCGDDGKWRNEWLEREFPVAAKAVVYLKHRKPETMIARWTSFVQQTWNKLDKKWETSDFWERLPDYMLGKTARAGALRAAFPDQLSEIYIREELQGQPELGESTDSDAQKIAEAQRREKEVTIPGAHVVETRGAQPTPEEAAEPAFEEDKIPQPPKFAEKLARDFGSSEEQNLDFGEEGGSPSVPSEAPAPASEPPWKSYALKSITNQRFAGRKLGELNESERSVLENQWVPKMQAHWDKMNEAQRADYPMVQACLAHYKVAKPWEDK